MAKSTVKIKHLGLFSTGKFAAVFSFIFSLLLLAVGVVVFILYAVLSLLIGVISGSYEMLASALMITGVSLVTFAVAAVVGVVAYTILGFIVGLLTALAFNIVVKLSGGLSFDADIV